MIQETMVYSGERLIKMVFRMRSFPVFPAYVTWDYNRLEKPNFRVGRAGIMLRLVVIPLDRTLE